jgi:hypothetical protein
MNIINSKLTIKELLGTLEELGEYPSAAMLVGSLSHEEIDIVERVMELCAQIKNYDSNREEPEL